LGSLILQSVKTLPHFCEKEGKKRGKREKQETRAKTPEGTRTGGEVADARRGRGKGGGKKRKGGGGKKAGRPA